MPIEFITGDIFVNRMDAQALAHGCNCQGSMGAGVAVGFKERYPEMYEEYRRRCKVRELDLGSFLEPPTAPMFDNNREVDAAD